MLWEAGELTTFLDRDLLPPSKVEEGLRRALSSDDDQLALREDDNGQSENSVAAIASAFFTFSLPFGSRIGSEAFRTAMARFGDEDERDDATADSQPDLTQEAVWAKQAGTKAAPAGPRRLSDARGLARQRWKTSSDWMRSEVRLSPDGQARFAPSGCAQFRFGSLSV
jgi:hypothetical protein